ncbi:hypothetical protein DdX_10663 [Ditylenchus destructor]|uniref:Uncharacterized protein n=1 Tax=Ditylenchus destructor TaxID=166010 RepID=A0AAD4N2H9_9BILA|nr:hypothetical protein DdX_10663 [Ditylenchus destructor]
MDYNGFELGKPYLMSATGQKNSCGEATGAFQVYNNQCKTKVEEEFVPGATDVYTRNVRNKSRTKISEHLL